MQQKNLQKIFVLVVLVLGSLAVVYLLSGRNDVQDAKRNSLGLQLAEGKPSVFQEIATEKLESQPNYLAEILPELKSMGAQGMLSRFTDDDWLAWPKAHVMNNGGPTVARSYLDQIVKVNIRLGVFLETVAQVVHDLSLATEQGLVFDLENAVSRLVKDPKAVLKYRDNLPLPADFMFTAEVTKDPIFVNIMETELAKMVGQYFQRHPENLKNHYGLVEAVADQAITGSLMSTLKHSLVALSSARYEDLLGFLLREQTSAKFTKLSASDADISRLLAYSYIMGAVGSLERGETIQAGNFLRVSTALQPSIRPTEVVKESFRKSARGEKQAVPFVVSSGDRSSARNVTAAGGGRFVSQVVEGRELSFLTVLSLFFACSALPVFGIFVYYRYFYIDVKSQLGLRMSRSARLENGSSVVSLEDGALQDASGAGPVETSQLETSQVETSHVETRQWQDAGDEHELRYLAAQRLRSSA